MDSSIKNILIDTFISDSSMGSPQHLHLFADEKTMTSEFISNQVKDEYDHSFIYYGDDHILVRWKNKAGEIHLCGSAAYAIAWYYLTNSNEKNILIRTKNLKLHAKTVDDKVILEVPIKVPSLSLEHANYSVFCDHDSGIYFVQLRYLQELKDVNFKHLCTLTKSSGEIHGLCAFFWNNTTDEGHLRYFTPWHGRAEDYVTGSIHQYLSPLVKKIFNVSPQSWTQHSQSQGQLNSLVSKDCVALWGQNIIRVENYSNH
jgi:predicted PhzF superfamily epimerase YddE/YHI9